MNLIAILTVLLLGCAVALVVLGRAWNAQRQTLLRVGPVVDADREAEALLHQARTQAGEISAQRSAMVAEAQHAEARVRQLEEAIAEMSAQLGAVAAEVDVESFGIYEPVFDFDDPESFRETIKALRSSQKELIKQRAAIRQSQAWYVNQSEKEGSIFIRNIERLVLLAFNGECDALITKVSATNWERSIGKIHKTQEQLNRIISGFFLELTYNYVHLKIQELRAKFELELRRAELKAAQKEAREQMREEKKMLQEVEREKKRLAKEEERDRNALNKARSELAEAHGEAKSALEARVLEMERLLADVQERTRTLSLAEQTRVGHVYIVSNVGSFGEQVFKVGMTRRLDPMDRVKELGDASVPFAFDVHAIIKADDAPALEAALHRSLNERRVNRVNSRKEFFRVTLDELLTLVKQHHGQVDYVRDPEASEFRQTMALIRAEAARATASTGASPRADGRAAG